MNTVGIPFRKDAKLKEPWGETDEERETAGGEREKQQSATDWASQRFVPNVFWNQVERVNVDSRLSSSAGRNMLEGRSSRIWEKQQSTFEFDKDGTTRLPEGVKRASKVDGNG